MIVQAVNIAELPGMSNIEGVELKKVFALSHQSVMIDVNG